MNSLPILKEDPAISEWYQDLYRSVLISRNRWLLIAAIALSVVLAQTIALISLIPLKKVEPYVIQIDNKSGITNVLKPLKDEKEKSLTENEAVTKSFIVKYMVARETYDPQDLNNHYDLVRLMSSSEEGKKFDDWVSNLNPNSPVERYKNTTTRTVKINSVSFLNNKTAQVRLMTTENQKNEHREDYWVAILTFRYVNSPMNETDRFNNPLGFQILSYRLDQEVIK